MTIVVFFLSPAANIASVDCEIFHDTMLGVALKFAEDRRKDGCRHVTISSELSDNVGKSGVDSIVDGKTPAGEIYDWSKAGRAGKIKRSERAAWDAEKDV